MQKPAKRADEYPIRINKYLALHGYDTRRGADELIKRGIVLVNGTVARPGEYVQEGDTVTVKQRQQKAYTYIAYHKPVGVITHSPQEGEVDIKQKGKLSGIPDDVFPLGRLDKASSGLIILTNDGRITDRLLHPDYEHEKEYVVRTKKTIGPSFKRILEKGVDIEGYTTRPCSVDIIGEDRFVIRLSEGKKHQIRRMVVALKNDVISLMRTRIMNIKIGTLKPGAHRVIDGKEKEIFLTSLGLLQK